MIMAQERAQQAQKKFFFHSDAAITIALATSDDAHCYQAMIKNRLGGDSMLVQVHRSALLMEKLHLGQEISVVLYLSSGKRSKGVLSCYEGDEASDEKFATLLLQIVGQLDDSDLTQDRLVPLT